LNKCIKLAKFWAVLCISSIMSSLERKRNRN